MTAIEINGTEFEMLGGEESGIILETGASKCKVCSTGKVVLVNRSNDEEKFMLYTIFGTKIGRHREYRCNNRVTPCRAGHFYGYVTLGDKVNAEKTRCYDRFALKREFLVTSNQTAFSVDLLWEFLLQQVFSNASFESLAQVYNNMHFVNLPTDVMLRREEIHRKRIADAVILFGFLELGQRYGIPPIISGGIDQTISANKVSIRDKFREVWTVEHLCDVKGCEKVLTVDGGMKPTRSLCAAKLNGIREFRYSGITVVTGCTKAPQPDSKFCGDHVGLSTPALSSDDVSEATRKSLRCHREVVKKYFQQFIILTLGLGLYF